MLATLSEINKNCKNLFKVANGKSASWISPKGWLAVYFIFLISLMQLQAAPSWMYDQIQEDLRPFQERGFDRADLENLIKDPSSAKRLFVKFSIKNNKLSLTPASFETDSRASVIASSIREILKKISIRDLDFVATMLDSLDGIVFSAPVFAFAKDPYISPTTVLMPDAEALSGNIHFLKDVAKGNYKYPWNKKAELAFWRGATTGGEFSLENFLTFPRSQAVALSIQFPNLINARFNLLVQCIDPNTVRQAYKEYFGNSVSVSNHIKYKYQLLIDGNTCAYSRAYWQLFANCTIFKQESPSIQWFYRCLKPWVHYVPLRSDLSDLPDAVMWAKNHDAECHEISMNANAFAKNNLTREHVLEYLTLLLIEYSRLQNR